MPCLSDLHKNKRAFGQKARKNMYKFPIIKGFGQFYFPPSEHLTTLEYPENDKCRSYHKQEGYNPRPTGCSKPSELNIHTKETSDQSRWHQHEGHKGKHLHDLVLIEIDDTENSILEILESLETEVRMIDQGRYVLEEDIQPVMVFLRIFRTLENT